MRYLTALILSLTLVAFATAESKKGIPPLKSVTSLAFGPDGVLFIGDPTSAKVFAVETGDKKAAGKGEVKIAKINSVISSLMGIPATELTMNDVKVNPASGNIYLAVTRGKGMDAAPVIFKVSRGEKTMITEFAMKETSYTAVELPSANDKQRTESITSMGFANGKLIVAGLSNEEFASTLRVIPYPFTEAGKPTGVKIYHGAHGKFETNAPVRTFATYKIGSVDHVVAAYTCTPLVKFPMDDLQPGAKVTGTTLAELGNRNRPLDMFVYKKDGKDFILMANSARGIMKISADKLDAKDGIVERIADTAGVKFEKIESWTGVEQLDKLDDNHAVVLMKTAEGLDLKSVELP
jgi:hypothetical protein